VSFGFIQPEGTNEWQASTLPQTIINPSGDWRPYAPQYEGQADRYETNGCTVWAAQNAIEFMQKQATGIEPNFSEYFTLILARVFPPGRPSHYADEAIKDYGLIPADMLPLPDTEEAYLKHRPTLSRYMLDEGKRWLSKWEFDREELWRGDIPLNRQAAYITYGLKRSPLAIGTKGHRTLITHFDGTYCTIFDTYNHTSSLRRLEDMEIRECVRFYLAKRVHTRFNFMDWLRGIMMKRP
jgi:hypothetical protein